MLGCITDHNCTREKGPHKSSMISYSLSSWQDICGLVPYSLMFIRIPDICWSVKNHVHSRNLTNWLWNVSPVFLPVLQILESVRKNFLISHHLMGDTGLTYIVNTIAAGDLATQGSQSNSCHGNDLWWSAVSDGLDIWLNTLRPRQNGCHFPDDIFQCIFLNENVWISSKISLKFVPKGQINNIPALVQIMAWRRPCDKPLSEPMLVSLLTHLCITRPQRVKSEIYTWFAGFSRYPGYIQEPHWFSIFLFPEISRVTLTGIQYIPRNMHTVLLCFALLWLCNRS